MSVSREIKDKTVLEDNAVARAIRAFYTVQAQNWRETQVNAVLPRVLVLVDEARAKGDAVDVGALIRKVHLDRDISGLLA
jgi:hypothetical protein